MYKDSIDERRAARAARRASRHAGRGTTSQVLMGVMVIAIGLLFFLDSLDVIDLHDALAFWPVVFIIAGTAKLLDTSSPNGYLVGLAGIGIGVAMILQRLGVLYFNWRQAWPVLLIGAGIFLVYRAMTAPHARTHGMVDDKQLDNVTIEESQAVDVTAILGGFERRVHTQDFRGGEVTAVMGGCVIDLRGASVRGDAVINVFAFWGGVTLKVPTDWTIVLQGTPILGGFEEKTVSPPDNGKRLVVRGYAIMGGVEVRN
jgi:predicted membrane protein